MRIYKLIIERTFIFNNYVDRKLYGNAKNYHFVRSEAGTDSGAYFHASIELAQQVCMYVCMYVCQQANHTDIFPHLYNNLYAILLLFAVARSGSLIDMFDVIHTYANLLPYCYYLIK